MNYTIYIHRNKTNNKAYIGQTSQKLRLRWRNGNGYKKCPHFYNAIQKYGWDGFEHIIWATGLSQEQANYIEKLLIALFNTTNQDFGYNIFDGGKNSLHTEETKQKMRVAKIGSVLTEEHKRKISESNKGNGRPGNTVYCIELNKIFKSTIEAERQLGIPNSNIGAVCLGKRKTAGGYHWCYIKEE